jgi:hypothetical protein
LTDVLRFALQEYEEYEKDEEARDAAEAKAAADVSRTSAAAVLMSCLLLQDKAAAEERKKRFEELKAQNKKYMPTEAEIADLGAMVGHSVFRSSLAWRCNCRRSVMTDNCALCAWKSLLLLPRYRQCKASCALAHHIGLLLAGRAILATK